MAVEAQNFPATADVSALLDALPKIGQYVGKTLVLKVGGSVRGEGTVLEDVAWLCRVGIRPVIVHGGGPQISAMLEKLGVETRFVEGRRYTDEQTLEVAHMVLSRLNGQFVSYLESKGVKAVGLNGLDGRMLQAKIRDERLGFVGDVHTADLRLARAVMQHGFVPVIAPIAAGPDAQPLNVNADSVAGEVAHALGAEHFFLFTDVPGVMDADGKVLPSLTRSDVERLIDAGVIRGGMLPKIESCLRALEAVPTVQVLDGREPHALLRALFTSAGIGTRLTQTPLQDSSE